MKEYFVISDIHSFYKAFKKALDEKGFDKDNHNHILIVCGDLFDRGPDSKELLDFIYDLFIQKRVVLIRGNHEDLFYDMINRGKCLYHDISNGTLKTLGQLHNPPYSEDTMLYMFFDSYNDYDKRLDEICNSMVDYYEIGNYIFVHGWIPVLEQTKGEYLYDPNWRKTDTGSFKLARWLNGMVCAEQAIIEPGKTIVCGHWHSSYGNVRKEFPNQKESFYKEKEFSNTEYFKPFYGDGIIAIDACTAYTGFCNCIKLTESEIYGGSYEA